MRSVCLALTNEGLSQVAPRFLRLLLESTRGELKQWIEIAKLFWVTCCLQEVKGSKEAQLPCWAASGDGKRASHKDVKDASHWAEEGRVPRGAAHSVLHKEGSRQGCGDQCPSCPCTALELFPLPSPMVIALMILKQIKNLECYS